MPKNQDCRVSVLQVFQCCIKGAFVIMYIMQMHVILKQKHRFEKNSVYFPNNVPPMNFKCIYIVNTIHSLHLR
jgi:hypothetical protein